MKSLLLFLSGLVVGAFLAVGALYTREPIFRKITSLRAGVNNGPAVVTPLRSTESSLGAASAPVTMIEYSDYECAFCGRFRRDIFPIIKAKYIDSGQVRFIHRHLPLPRHPQAMMAAMAAACAGDQDLFWELNDLMFFRTSCLECQGVL